MHLHVKGFVRQQAERKASSRRNQRTRESRVETSGFSVDEKWWKMLLLAFCKCTLSFAENLSLDMPDVIWQDLLDYGHALYLQSCTRHEPDTKLRESIRYARTARNLTGRNPFSLGHKHFVFKNRIYPSQENNNEAWKNNWRNYALLCHLLQSKVPLQVTLCVNA